ncbi:MAG: hypothetical protein H0U49_11865 [Parachlamydiaceae bacterium]|nr:hypothetical protein [Parachlamydiaceae bacterium]
MNTLAAYAPTANLSVGAFAAHGNSISTTRSRVWLHAAAAFGAATPLL